MIFDHIMSIPRTQKFVQYQIGCISYWSFLIDSLDGLCQMREPLPDYRAWHIQMQYRTLSCLMCVTFLCVLFVFLHGHNKISHSYHLAGVAEAIDWIWIEDGFFDMLKIKSTSVEWWIMWYNYINNKLAFIYVTAYKVIYVITNNKLANLSPSWQVSGYQHWQTDA